MKYIVSLSLCFLFCLPCFSQTGLDSITNRLQHVYKESSLPGFAVAIVTRDTVVYKQAFGFADIEKGTSFTPETVLNIGSVSKTFIGMALLKAVEQGKLSLDADINDYLPLKLFILIFLVCLSGYGTLQHIHPV
jgi:CubicO group peptidase (beta-lactamase class C family)